MSGKTLTREAFHIAESKAKKEGSSVTARAEQRLKETGTVDPLVDPSKNGVIRRSISRKDRKGKYWILNVGTAMPVEQLLDTTGSMGGNVEIAFKVLPDTYDLLKAGKKPVLVRYDVQIATSIFGDVQDKRVLLRSEFEMDVKIAEQMRMMTPEKDGGDTPEDPEFGLFGAAYLTAADIVALGLKGYHFLITDANSHGHISSENLVRVFGNEVLEKVKENGHQVTEPLPKTAQIVKDLLALNHGFVLSVGGENHEYWEKFYGKERVIILPSTELLPQVEAAIIGLTEGTLNLQDVEQFLTEHGNIKTGQARQVLKAVQGIPIGAQAALPNFHRIPMMGDRFAKKLDLWPIEEEKVENDGSEEPEDMWK